PVLSAPECSASRSRRYASAPLRGRPATAPVASGRRRLAFAFWLAHQRAARTSWSITLQLWRPSSSACSCPPSPIFLSLAPRSRRVQVLELDLILRSADKQLTRPPRRRARAASAGR